VPDWDKPSFVIFDIRALGRTLSVRVSGCQKLQMMVWHRMLYSCTHTATVAIKGLKKLHIKPLQPVQTVSWHCKQPSIWHWSWYKRPCQNWQLYSSCWCSNCCVTQPSWQEMRWLMALQNKWPHNPILHQNHRIFCDEHQKDHASMDHNSNWHDTQHCRQSIYY